MNETDIQKIRKKGIPIQKEYLEEKYTLVEGDSMADIMTKTIVAIQAGKKPVVIIDERFQKGTKIEEKRAFNTENQMYLRKLEMISRHIGAIYKESPLAPNDYILYPTEGIQATTKSFCKDCIWNEIFSPVNCPCSRSPTNYPGQKFTNQFEAIPKAVSE